jgi:hypothetical protein
MNEPGSDRVSKGKRPSSENQREALSDIEAAAHTFRRICENSISRGDSCLSVPLGALPVSTSPSVIPANRRNQGPPRRAVWLPDRGHCTEGLSPCGSLPFRSVKGQSVRPPTFALQQSRLRDGSPPSSTFPKSTLCTCQPPLLRPGCGGRSPRGDATGRPRRKGQRSGGSRRSDSAAAMRACMRRWKRTCPIAWRSFRRQRARMPPRQWRCPCGDQGV